MPQMSPMLWTMLFFMFIFLFLFFNILNYFNFSPIFKNSEMNSTKKNKNNQLIWKW
uniref:ATP synthase F0 subunit 8 n=1 Tax=Axarus fungorum TaxID=2661749 RepID=UPI002027889E|nr:ATP synthase F0 subunit 8 [Axarus fungorum]UQK95132.1 ATP synthase F0 subunit 8 [Axarus fungorum]